MIQEHPSSRESLPIGDVDWLDILRRMHRIRAFEFKAIELFRRGVLPGFLHPSIGQEAAAVGFTYLLTDHDSINTTHRGHGHILGKGAPLEPMFAELYGYEEGLCHGRGGSMHLADREHGILGANGIVGAGIPIAVGAALAMQLDGKDAVTVSFFGDGAVNTGAFHEGVNLAAIWKLPVVFVCENNGYAESTRFEDVIGTKDLGPRAAGYGIASSVVDGNDVAACLEASSAAIDRARAGEGPTLIQANTYRWFGHHIGDPAVYREEAELNMWKSERDPIVLFEQRLVAEMGIAAGDLSRVKEEAEAEVAQAAERGAVGTVPDPRDLERYLYGSRAPLQNEVPHV